MISEIHRQPKVFEYKDRSIKYPLGYTAISALAMSIIFLGFFQLGALVGLLGLIVMFIVQYRDDQEPHKLVLDDKSLHIYWANRSLSFNLDEVRVEELESEVNSDKHLVLISGGNVFRVYSHITDYNYLKSTLLSDP